MRVQLVDGAERGDAAVELRDARAVAEARLAAVAAARVDPRQADGLIPFPRHGHRLQRVEVRPARVDEMDALARLFIRARTGWTTFRPVPDEAAVSDRRASSASTKKSGSRRRTAGRSASSRSRRRGTWRSSGSREALRRAGRAEPRRRHRPARQGEGASPGRALPLGVPAEPGAAALRAAGLRARAAHRRRRQHGARARRALPLGP